jgi:hypothetical protein
MTQAIADMSMRAIQLLKRVGAMRQVIGASLRGRLW